jgi:hypothetical protein
VPEINQEKLDRILWFLKQELESAMTQHPSFTSMHEGFAVIHEEFDELKAEVWKNPRKHPDRLAKATTEALQLAAMSIRFLHDVGGISA